MIYPTSIIIFVITWIPVKSVFMLIGLHVYRVTVDNRVYDKYNRNVAILRMQSRFPFVKIMYYYLYQVDTASIMSVYSF